jgi:hypothetical protein
LPKPHKPPHEPKLCQRACKLPHEEKKFLKMATARGKDKMNDIEIKIKSDKKTKHETITKAICNKPACRRQGFQW